MHSFDSRLFADTYQAFVVVTNRATTVEGEVSVEDEETSREMNGEDFSVHDDLMSDMVIGGLQEVDPACTLRSTQQSNAEDPDVTQLVGQSDDYSQSNRHDEAQETAAETESSSFDIVSDSNSEDANESFCWEVTEE
ncbi:unnamed protein product [Phytophthora fragariaefolia]|uniref:Unnamed protein product n=1 Tax=Phytophthora fragariaefolia TaxID=1490495 RepID=A0A9W6TXY6_9STRA|nr:unnamed protein product [Phytophthora fragariaefolia]